MKIVIPGGTGQVGTALNRAFSADGHEVMVLTRGPARDGRVVWDGETLGAWADVINGSDVVINLAGRSVSCRYHLRSSLRCFKRRGHRGDRRLGDRDPRLLVAQRDFMRELRG
jgi:NAD dependent epimerase/dehydratase family enzyme